MLLGGDGSGGGSKRLRAVAEIKNVCLKKG
jgi:hypothetical protein